MTNETKRADGLRAGRESSVSSSRPQEVEMMATGVPIPDDWNTMASLPDAGREVEVAHSLDPRSFFPGKYLGVATGSHRDGFWSCSEAFVCIDNMLRFQPTHWRDTDGSPEGRDAQRLDGEAATAGAEGIAQTNPGDPS